ncbi:hypothetical protein BCE75_108216 [Isoptericola sp. CG 20/1183]|uniref:Integral membrane protein n=1 Tax=Isoptericola halotolerans TaxID=300560 RepID=A0ABX5ECH4_9MICO|nr:MULTISPECIES: hypothetical protein [Isoptericola]PRZ05234.1 hypothetical protein BCL65_108217 [Isoptericola halotolerans]PRZ05972.1 hypothetical protein BCE75_108216 [Isoptericola sp. CG 20/1183]
MSDPQRPYGAEDPTRSMGRVPSDEQPPGVVPVPGRPSWSPAQPLPPQRPQLDVGRYWAGAAATVLVCALLGLAASVIFDEVFDIGLYAPPDVLGAGDDASWAGAGAVFALLGAAVLHLLVVIAPRPRMFFGWLVGLTTVILAVLPFTGNPDPLAGAMTALVWVILGLAVSSMLGSVLGRTLSVPVTTT